MSSEVVLLDVQASRGVSDKKFLPPWDIRNPIDVGEAIWFIGGTVQNKHAQNRYIALWAIGHDDAGKEVAWTLDAAHILGQILVSLENGETDLFALHLNMSENVRSFRIFAASSVEPPP